MPKKAKHLSDEPVVHPWHPHAYDAAYHDVMSALKFNEWLTPMQLAVETRHDPKEVRRVLALMIKEGNEVGDETLEVGRSDEGKCYRFGGISRG